RIELEANEFSAALLVPLQEFGVELRRLGRGCDISHVFTLADLFDVSGEMMTRVYVDNVGEKAAVIIAHNHVVKRIIPGPDFPYLGLRGGMPMPLPALDRAFRPAAGEATTSDLIEVPTDR
ncbi:hypothetical protein JZU69_01885, partial [bacterium]|nr:hypothetical protein [bacterium]